MYIPIHLSASVEDFWANYATGNEKGLLQSSFFIWFVNLDRLEIWNYHKTTNWELLLLQPTAKRSSSSSFYCLSWASYVIIQFRTQNTFTFEKKKPVTMGIENKRAKAKDESVSERPIKEWRLVRNGAINDRCLRSLLIMFDCNRYQSAAQLGIV